MLTLIAAVDASAASDVTKVFTDAEVHQCGDIRIPQMTITPSGVLLVAQCRSANQTGDVRVDVRDNMVHAKVVTKLSADNGTTWGPMKVLTPIAHSHGQVVYDAVRQRVLLHYQLHPNVDPTINSTLFQRLSHDDGATWGSERAITPLLARCNPEAPQNMQVGSAGSKVQTASGRIIFLGHANGVACRWWTDDGGETYNPSLPYVGNEASVAETGAGQIYMNARGLTYAWKGNRTSYFSSDDGADFSSPVACPVREDAPFGCSAGLVADPFTPNARSAASAAPPRRLFLSEPSGPERKGLVVHCSLDGGRTWPASVRVNGEQPAAYSAMRIVRTAVRTHRILVVWEEKPNFLATHLDTAWCR